MLRSPKAGLPRCTTAAARSSAVGDCRFSDRSAHADQQHAENCGCGKWNKSITSMAESRTCQAHFGTDCCGCCCGRLPSLPLPLLPLLPLLLSLLRVLPSCASLLSNPPAAALLHRAGCARPDLGCLTPPSVTLLQKRSVQAPSTTHCEIDGKNRKATAIQVVARSDVHPSNWTCRRCWG